MVQRSKIDLEKAKLQLETEKLRLQDDRERDKLARETALREYEVEMKTEAQADEAGLRHAIQFDRQMQDADIKRAQMAAVPPTPEETA